MQMSENKNGRHVCPNVIAIGLPLHESNFVYKNKSFGTQKQIQSITSKKANNSCKQNGSDTLSHATVPQQKSRIGVSAITSYWQLDTFQGYRI